MKFTSPRQMRAELGAVINDTAYLEKLVGDYFAENEPEPTPAHSPLNKPPKHHGTAVNAIQREDERHEAMMANGSHELGQAIDVMLEGGDPHTPKRLKWSRRTGEEMRLANGLQEPDFEPLEYVPPKPLNPSPCFKCGAARGCEHRA